MSGIVRIMCIAPCRSGLCRGCASGRYREAGNQSHAASFLCDAPARVRVDIRTVQALMGI